MPEIDERRRMAIELAIKTLSFGRTISYQVSLTVLGSAALQRSRVSSCEVEAGNTYGLQLMNKAQFWGTAATLFFPQVGDANLQHRKHGPSLFGQFEGRRLRFQTCQDLSGFG